MEKKSLEEYQSQNILLKELHAERIKRRKLPETDSAKAVSLEPIVFSDGSTIFLTPIDFIDPSFPHFITLRQLLYEDLQNLPNQPKTIQSALLTTFCFEESFLQPIVSQNFPVCLVVHNKTEKIYKPTPFLTIVSPAIPIPYGSFHAKLFLIKFPGRLRVVVTSANLILCDWSKIGQVVWFQDFFVCPKKVDCEFKEDLKGFLKEVLSGGYRIGEELGIELDEFDFSMAKVKLVASVPGRFGVQCGFGMSRMKALVRNQYLGCLYQCSSVGGFNKASVQNFLKMTANKKGARLDIVFPSFKNVQDSFLGPKGAGVFFLRQDHYEKAGFPKDSFCNFEGPELFQMLSCHLSHSKVMILHNDYSITDNTILYFGSHNFSGAAWGILEKNGTQIFIKNYELGILFLDKPGSAEDKRSMISRLPFKFPPVRYAASDRPFFIDTDLSE